MKVPKRNKGYIWKVLLTVLLVAVIGYFVFVGFKV